MGKHFALKILVTSSDFLLFPFFVAGTRPKRQVREKVRGATSEGVPRAADPVRPRRPQGERPHGLLVVRGGLENLEGPLSGTYFYSVVICFQHLLLHI